LLTQHNARRPDVTCRLRVAVHCGEVHYDRHGPFGEAVDLTCRLVDAPELKARLRLGSESTVLAISDALYGSIVRHRYAGIDDTDYRPLIRIDLAGRPHRGWVLVHPAGPRHLAQRRDGLGEVEHLRHGQWLAVADDPGLAASASGGGREQRAGDLYGDSVGAEHGDRAAVGAGPAVADHRG
jgi:hypothetical protein